MLQVDGHDSGTESDDEIELADASEYNPEAFFIPSKISLDFHSSFDFPSLFLSGFSQFSKYLHWVEKVSRS